MLEKMRKKLFRKKPRKKQTIEEEIREWIVSFIVAAVIYFIVMPAIFGSSSPAVVVSSCSEKGNLNIGDIIFVGGVDPRDINAPEVASDGIPEVSLLFDSGGDYPVEINRMLINGQLVAYDNSNDIIVYNSDPRNYQIIHHAFAKINIGGDYYIITRGSANAIPDQIDAKGNLCFTENSGSCLSTAVSEEMLIGRKVLPHVPILGHVKLFFCDITLNMLCEGHANAGTDYRYMLTC